MLVEAHETLASIAREKAIMQAVLSGPGSNEGFDAATRAFRSYTEAVTPWIGVERRKMDDELKRRAKEFSRYLVQIREMSDEERLPPLQKL